MSGRSSGGDTDDETRPERRQGDLVPRPVWTGLTVMPRIQGLAAASIDTKRARLCTVTNLHIKDGRQAGGEITLWSLRTTERILSSKLPVPADGVVKHTLKLFYSGPVKSFIGVAASGLLWACDHITLQPCGSLQAHDRQCLDVVLHINRQELICFFADGMVKVLRVSSSVTRDSVKMRNITKTDFTVVRSWPSGIWCETCDIDEQTELLVAAAETGVYCWNLLTGAVVTKFENTHPSKVVSVHCYSARGERRCATGGLAGEVKIWALKPEGLVKYLDFEAHKDAAVVSICFELSQGTQYYYTVRRPVQLRDFHLYEVSFSLSFPCVSKCRAVRNDTLYTASSIV